MSLDNLKLSDLQKLQDDIPGLGNFPSRLLVKTYDDFIDVLYKDLDEIILDTEQNPDLYSPTDKEDRLTIEIKKQLRCMGYDALHDFKIGGHADLVVRLKAYIWIGEAKIHRNYEYLWQGFQQLFTRYSTGEWNQKDGGLIIYIFQNNLAGIMKKWQEYLLKQELPDCDLKACPTRPQAFFSSHIHPKSGTSFRVKHMPIMLHFNPQDKSGKNRKNKQ